MVLVALPRRARDLGLVAVLLGLPVLFLRANYKAPNETNMLDRLLLRVSAPIQAAATAGTSAVHRTWRRYVYLIGVQGENEELRRERDTLTVELQQARRQLRRMARYERLLAFRTRRGIETLGARVIARPPSPFVRALRVSIDREAGVVRTGMPVVTRDGVVGRVGRTFGGYSEVVLAVDPTSAIDVVVRRTASRGLLRGVDGTDRYVCRIDYLLRQEPVRKGDLVVTSGAAGVFPEGLPVGRISGLKERASGLYREVEVTPLVDFSLLDDVLVVLAPPPPAVDHFAEQGPIPARGLAP